MKSRGAFWAFFILISLLGIICGYLFFENQISILANRKLRYSLIVVAIVTITMLGYFAFGMLDAPWIKKIWLLFYGLSLLMLIVFGLIDLFVYDFSYAIKKDLHHFRTLLITPLPFLVLYFFYKIASRP